MRRRLTRLAAPLFLTLSACQGQGAAQGEERGADAGAPTVHAGPASVALRYAAPACPQRYAFTMTIGSPAAAAAGLQLRGELLLEAIDERHLALRVDKLDAASGLPPALGDTLGARFVLELADDRRSLAAVERPTPLWDAFGTFGGLQVFWPTLPESTDPGASATWTLALPKSSGPTPPSPAGPRLVPQAAVPPPGDPTGAAPAEAPVDANGAEAAAPLTTDAEVKLDRWDAQAGRPLAVLSASWQHDSAASGADARGGHGVAAARVKEISFRSSTRGQANYRLIGGDRLFSAELSHEQQVSIAIAGVDNPPTTIRSSAELRLIDACDGPTLDAPKPAPTNNQNSARD